MSFTNDDEHDGLASLFGGITPQVEPPARTGRRRAPDPTGDDTTPVTPPASTPPPAYTAPPASPPPPAYAPPPAYTPPPAYPSPASAPEPPTFGGPAEPPAFPGPAYTPPSYAAPSEPPAPAPSGAFGEPAAEPQPYLPPAEPQPYVPQPYVPPAYVPPVTPAAPSSTPPAGSPPHSTSGFDLPAPVEPQVGPYGAPPQYPGLQDAAPRDPDPAPGSSTQPPTVQYPGLRPFAAQGGPFPAQGRTAAPEPVPAPPPLSEPPRSEPGQQFGSFADLGLGPGEPDSTSTADDAEEPEVGRADDTPAHAEQGAAVVPASSDRGGSVPVLRRPPGPLLPVENPVLESTEDLARATTLEKVGLGLAVIGGPVGLGFAIVNGIRGVRRRGWLTGVGRWSIALGVLSTVVAGIGGVALWNAREAQLQHAEIAAASAEFCAAATENPEIVELPYLGWPAPGPTITESLALMQEWTTRWSDLAAVSPAELREGLELLATRGGEVIAAVEQTRLVRDEENKRLIGATANSSGVAGWYQTYCATP